MPKIIRKARPDRSDLTGVVITDPKATVPLTGEKGWPSNLKPSDVFEEANRVLAHRKWEVAGRPEGDGVEFWLEAERELKAERSTSESIATSVIARHAERAITALPIPLPG